MKITLSKRIDLLAFLLPCALALNASKAPTSMPTGSQILCAAWTVELAALLPPNLLLI